MGRLPVYTNNANIRVAEANKISPLYDGRAIDSLAGNIKDLSVQWQETQNAAESLDGKNKMLAQTSDILTEAENFHDYKNPAEIKAKEDELLGKMDSVLKTVSGGFTNERNAANFNQKYFLTMEENKEALKAKFRKKFIDNANANLAISYENNMQNYISSGSEAYKKSYLADVENMYNAGYIDQEEKTLRSLKIKEWDFDYVMNVAASDAKKAQGLVAGLKIGDGKKAQMLLKIGELKNQQLQYARQTALVSLIEDRTEESAKAYIALYPDMSDKKKQSVMDYVRGIEYGTEEGGAGYTSVAEAQQEIKDIAKHFTDSAFDQGVGLDKTFDVAKKTADAVYRSKNLTTEEGKQINDMLSGMMSDKLFAEKVANMPFYYDEHWDLTIGIMKTGQPGYADKMIKHNEKVFAIKGLQKKYNSMMIDAALKGANPEQIQSIYKDGLREIVKTQYRDLVPNIDSFSFKEGDTFVANGKAIKFIGFDKDDMIVEVQ